MVLEVYYTCPCGRTFKKMNIFGVPSEKAKCPFCGKEAHRNRLKELAEELKDRPGI